MVFLTATIRVRLAVLLVALVSFAGAISAQAMDSTSSKELGLSAEKSLTFKRELQRRVDSGEMPVKQPKKNSVIRILALPLARMWDITRMPPPKP